MEKDDKHVEKIWERETKKRPNSAPPRSKQSKNDATGSKGSNIGDRDHVGSSNELLDKSLNKTTTSSKFLDAMIERQTRCNKIRQDRLEEKKKREDHEKTLREEEEKKKLDKLFDSKLPDTGRRLTKAAEERAKLVPNINCTI